MQCSFDRSLLSAVPRVCSSQICDMFYATIIHLVNTIWLASNECRFSSKIFTLHGAKIFITLLWFLLHFAIGGIIVWTLVSRSCLLLYIVSAIDVQISWLIMHLVLRIISGGKFYPLLLAIIFLEIEWGFLITVFLRSRVLFWFAVSFCSFMYGSPRVQFSLFLINFMSMVAEDGGDFEDVNLVGMSCLLLMFSIAFDSTK